MNQCTSECSVYIIRFYNQGLSKAVVLAESEEEAVELLKADYAEYNIEIQIEEVEWVGEKGVTLTWHEPLSPAPSESN